MKRYRRSGRFEVPDWLMAGYVFCAVCFLLNIVMWVVKK